MGDTHRRVRRRRAIERVDVRVLRLATEGGPESDGTAMWSATTMVLVQVRCGGVTGLGYSYVDAAAAEVIRGLLAPCIVGQDAFAIPAIVARMLVAIRNHGRPGIVAAAISAVDVALWDLKARTLGLALADLLGASRRVVPVYASGGFTSLDLDELAAAVARYAAAGHRRIKIKIGRDNDVERVRIARAAAGEGVELMVDANGAYDRAHALAMAERFAEHGVTYFEEPVSSDDLDGLRTLRDRAPAGMAIAAGEYGYDSFYFRRMLDAGAVHILQADATRCLGITGFLQADVLCASRCTPLSAHCAPAIHVHAGAAANRLVHIEAFHDHVRMEALLFDGAPEPIAGEVTYDRSRHGLGLELREHEVRRHAI